MPVHLPKDTHDALTQGGSLLCQNRSLYFDRFADPASERDGQKKWFDAGMTIVVPKEATNRGNHHPTAHLLYARLQSRLMLNMAGGVMENAGLSLDRYGLPYIPGSAVKGCARRMALQALHDWVEAKTARPSADDIGAPCCKGFDNPAEMLAVICHVFGWVEQDWNTKSDLAWACGQNCQDVWTPACGTLAKTFGWNLPETAPWKKLPNFAGSVAFLPAHPNADPGIELDVLTPHHKAYYESKNPEAVATDTEDPVPVFFPAVKPQKEGEYFTFPLLPLRRSLPLVAELGTSFADPVEHARIWLSHGLEIFGLGAKTNAGYGWFDASEELNQRVAQHQVKKTRQLEDQAKQAQEKVRQELEAKAKGDAKAALDAEFAGQTPEQQEDKKVAMLSDHQFEAKIRAYCKEPKKGGPLELEKQAIVRALRGPRLAYWQTFKTMATKGELATVDQAIRLLSKTLNLGKMP